MDRQINGWMDRWTDGWIDGRKDGQMDGWMDGWMESWVVGKQVGREESRLQVDRKYVSVTYVLVHRNKHFSRKRWSIESKSTCRRKVNKEMQLPDSDTAA